MDILDVWGEGRIYNGNMISGFRQAYNLNKDTQKISNGPNEHRDIPNFIQVSNYDTPKFPLADGIVNFMTVMNSPITAGTAKEMYRVLNKERGVVILYDFKKDDKFQGPSITNFEANMGTLTLRQDIKLDKPFSEIVTNQSGNDRIYGFSGSPTVAQVTEADVQHDEL
jgi:hypothetical protein